MRIQLLLVLALYDILPALSQTSNANPPLVSVPDPPSVVAVNTDSGSWNETNPPPPCSDKSTCLLTDTTPDPSKKPLPEIITLVPAEPNRSARFLNATLDLTAPSLKPYNKTTVLDPSTIHPPTDTSTLIRIGFTHALNYDFLLTNPAAVYQIYTYFPTAIAQRLHLTGFELEQEHNTSIKALQSYDARLTNFNYRISLVYLYVPTYRMWRLRDDWAKTSEALDVGHSERVVDELLLKVDRSIPLTGGMLIEGSNQELKTTVDDPEYSVEADETDLKKSEEREEEEVLEGDDIKHEIPDEGATGNSEAPELSDFPASPSKQVIIGASIGSVMGLLVTSLFVILLLRHRRKKQPYIGELDADTVRAELEGQERVELGDTERRELENTGRVELEGDGVDELDGKMVEIVVETGLDENILGGDEVMGEDLNMREERRSGE